MARGLMSDAEWAFFEPFVREVRAPQGRPAGDHRRVLDGVFAASRGPSGLDRADRSRGPAAPGATCPKSEGKWSSVYRQFRRWTLVGLWEAILEALNEGAAKIEPAPDRLRMVDSTIVRAHQHAAGAPKKGAGLCAPGSWPLARWPHDRDPPPGQRVGPADASGCHARPDLRSPRLRPRDGRRPARAGGSSGRQGLRQRPHPGLGRGARWGARHPDAPAPQGAKGCRSRPLRPAQPHRANCIGRLKHSRRIATRYDKTATSLLGFLDLACIRLWVRDFVNKA